ncbi:hypothetical protein TNCV_910961 [Trichonephila clavipes]|uniref:Uncharacterized protein n=1 Tax=Trichonephila clavipes TaxID=2585209 RepID=A0A8X7BDH7_TRICX|nr:hypothetical protein TNCV_910961 [Trichonephila clavipes]
MAKEATCQDMSLLMSVPLSHWKHVAWERTVSSSNTEFLASPEAFWTKSFFYTIIPRTTALILKTVTPRCLEGPLIDRDRLNAYPGYRRILTRSLVTNKQFPRMKDFESLG